MRRSLRGPQGPKTANSPAVIRAMATAAPIAPRRFRCFLNMLSLCPTSGPKPKLDSLAVGVKDRKGEIRLHIAEPHTEPALWAQYIAPNTRVLAIANPFRLAFDPALLCERRTNRMIWARRLRSRLMAMGLAENRRPTADSSYWVMNAWEEQCGFCGSGSAGAAGSRRPLCDRSQRRSVALSVGDARDQPLRRVRSSACFSRWRFGHLSVAVMTPIAVGVLGGFTTFSTFRAWEGFTFSRTGHAGDGVRVRRNLCRRRTGGRVGRVFARPHVPLHVHADHGERKHEPSSTSRRACPRTGGRGCAG